MSVLFLYGATSWQDVMDEEDEYSPSVPQIGRSARLRPYLPICEPGELREEWNNHQYTLIIFNYYQIILIDGRGSGSRTHVLNCQAIAVHPANTNAEGPAVGIRQARH